MNFNDYKNTNGYGLLMSLAEGRDFLDKIEADKELSENEKILFMEYLAKYDISSDGDIKNYCCAYFQNGKKFLSTNSYNNDLDHPFIRIKDIVRFSGWIKEIINEDIDDTIRLLSDDLVPGDIKDIAYKALITTEIRDEILNDPARSIHYLGVTTLSSSDSPNLESAKTDPWIVWSFPLPDDEPDLFSSIKLPILDCRAGLSENVDLDKIVYLHNISSCKQIKKPTVFDSEFYMQFTLGGKTKPLDGCDDKDGFDEYIHDPNRFKDIIETPKFIKK